jgi:hypothetical protein
MEMEHCKVMGGFALQLARGGFVKHNEVILLVIDR